MSGYDEERELEEHSAFLANNAIEDDIGDYPDPFTRPEDLPRRVYITPEALRALERVYGRSS